MCIRDSYRRTCCD